MPIERTILVTGANRGLGLETIRQYAHEGWKVFACCRAPEKANQLQKIAERFNNVNIFRLDVTNIHHIKNLVDILKDVPIDILMNIAGIWGPINMTFGKLNLEDWLKVFKINTIAPLLLAAAFFKNVSKSKLKIIAIMSSNMGSIALNETGGEYLYRSSKTALNAATKSLSIDLKNKKIIVIALHPGWVKTDMGGPNAQIDVQESIRGLRKVLASVTLQDTGSFIGYDGEKISW